MNFYILLTFSPKYSNSIIVFIHDFLTNMQSLEVPSLYSFYVPILHLSLEERFLRNVCQIWFETLTANILFVDLPPRSPFGARIKIHTVTTLKKKKIVDPIFYSIISYFGTIIYNYCLPCRLQQPTLKPKYEKQSS